MRANVLLPVLSLLVLGSAQPAWAASDSLVSADPAVILEITKGFGSAELSQGKDGSPLITGRIEGVRYVVVFRGCDKGKCGSITFYSGWKLKNKPFPLETVNAFNARKRWAKGYIDQDGDLALDMDVELEHGMSRKNLDETFADWSRILRNYRDTVVKKAEAADSDKAAPVRE